MREKEIGEDLGSAWSMNAQDSIRSLQVGNLNNQRIVSPERIMREGDWNYFVEEDESYCPGVKTPYAAIAGYTGTDASVSIPNELGGLPVCEIFEKAFQGNLVIEYLDMPDSVKTVGLKAFASCRKLRSIKFANEVEELDSTVLSGCSGLEEVLLPDSLRNMPARLLSTCPLEHVFVPRGVEKIDPQSLNTKTLKELEVAKDNRAYSSDGVALYTKDGLTLVALMTQVSSYAIAKGCQRIENAAFKGASWLQSVELPEGLKEIGDYAFFRTSLNSLKLPESLWLIGDHAFEMCKGIDEVVFGSELAAIGSCAFAKTSIETVRIPASVAALGPDAFSKSGVDFTDSNSFSIDADSNYLYFQDGALYRKSTQGLHAYGAMMRLEKLEIADGTVDIDEGAFEHERTIEQVVLPEGLATIGARAFKHCESLTKINLPESLQSVGEEAFWRTRVESLYIGANLTNIDKYAFEVCGATRRNEDRTLRNLVVSKDNPRYYYQNNLLIERVEQGDRTILFVEPCERIEIPQQVTYISEMTFYHACAKEIVVHAGIKKIDIRAFLGLDGIKRAHVEFSKPIEGLDHVDLLFPGHARDIEDFSRVFSLDEDGEFFDFATYDEQSVHELDPDSVICMSLVRMAQPIKMISSAKANYASALERLMPVAMRIFANKCDKEGYRILLEHGCLEGKLLEQAISIAEQEGAQESMEYLGSLR